MIRIEVSGGPYDGTQFDVHRADPFNPIVEVAIYGMPLQKEGDLYILEWSEVERRPSPEEIGRVAAYFLPLINPAS